MKKVAWCIAWILTTAGPLSAQQDSLLAEAVRLTTEGQRDSARSLVAARLGEMSPLDSGYAEALFAAGVVSADPDTARIYFRRVSIEFSQTEWADRALVRLSQLAFAESDFDASIRYAERVMTDYPFSELRGDAAYWAARSLFESGRAESACTALDSARANAGDDVELLNRVRFYSQRCRGLATGDSASADSVAPGRSYFAVQVAALSSPAAVDEVMRNLTSAGYQPRVRRDDDGLFRVRVGRFRDRAGAEQLARELAGELGGQPFVVEES